MYIDLDKVTAMSLVDFQRTDIGILLQDWMDQLVESRKEFLVSHRGVASIPDMWHDQGFISGVRAVGHLFDAARVVADSGEEQEQVEVPDPAYLGADPNNPRR